MSGMTLAQFLDCSDPEESERLLERLIREQALPVVEKVVGSKIRGATGEDVRSEVIADLISRLRRLKASGDRDTIPGLSALTAL